MALESNRNERFQNLELRGEGELVREVREREVMGESESEGERESDIFYLNDCGVQMTKLWK